MFGVREHRNYEALISAVSDRVSQSRACHTSKQGARQSGRGMAKTVKSASAR